MGSGFFNIFHLEFIKPAAKLKFTKKMLPQEFMHKLFSRIQDRMNPGLEYLDNIKNLTTYCQKIYDQILATNQIQLNIKSTNTKLANISTWFSSPTRFFSLSYQTTSSSTSCYRFKPGNTFSSFINKEWLKLIKERKCFYSWWSEHTKTNHSKSITKVILVPEIAGKVIDNSKKFG